ncbi:MAG TPA: flavin reductase family protein [Pirellulales bacterium]|jgi:flavin reductase (DIM6/NTAB) family NADH-FMN oxidoreductase RutF|nr:flavin reductase family protein [Pirellulales bacterium]
MDFAVSSELFALADRELWLITSQAEGRRGGLIATFVSHASLVPELPRILVAIAKQHHTWRLIESSGAFAAHLLAERSLEWVWRFGLQSGRDIDKLAGLSIEQAATGSPLLGDALGWLDCRVETQFDTGDRTVYVAEVLEARRSLDGPPLTMKRLLELAPPERLEQLRQLRLRDSAIDAAAIRAWRKESRKS